MTASQAIITDISFFLLVFYVGLFLSLVFVPMSGRIARALGVLDFPDVRKIHRNPLPRMGGAGIALAFAADVLLCFKMPPLVQGVLLGGAIIFFTGLLDDLLAIPPKLKFIGEILAVTSFMMVSGVSIPGFGNLLGIGNIQFGSLTFVATIFCMVGSINALNLSDGLDGLAGGISVIALFFMAVLSYSDQAWFFLVFSLAGLGAVLGFLRYNSHPAKLFMGDCGSLLLGFLLAAVSVGLVQGAGLYKPLKPIVVATILALPVVDTIIVMTGRIRRKENPFLPDKTHLHHRLLAMGLPHGSVVIIIYGISTLFGILGLLGSTWPEWGLFSSVIVMCTCIYTLAGRAEKNYASNYANRRFRRGGKFLNKNYRRFMTRLSGRITPYLLPIFLLLLLFPALLVIPTTRWIGYCALASCLIVILLYPWRGGKHEMYMAHGVFSLMVFCTMTLFMFSPNRPTWLFGYFVVLSVAALLWSLLKILFTRNRAYIMPSSFELLLVLMSWLVPTVFSPFLGISENARTILLQSAAMATPILMLFKLTTKRHARRNVFVALSFVSVFVFIGGASFII